MSAANGLCRPGGRRSSHTGRGLRADRLETVRVTGGRALVGVFGNEGFFAAPRAASPAAADALVRSIAERMRGWGATRVEGPVSPLPFDFSGGAALGPPARPSPFSAWMPAFLGEALEARGFRVAARSLLYELDPARFDWPLGERAASAACRRFGVTVVSARTLGDRAACAAIARASRTDPAFAHTDEETAALLTALGRRWSRPLTQIALHDGEPVGYLLALRQGRVARAATMQVAPAWRNRALTAALALPMLRAAAGLRIECGVIAQDNLASRFTAERAGARLSAVFVRYELTEI